MTERIGRFLADYFFVEDSFMPITLFIVLSGLAVIGVGILSTGLAYVLYHIAVLIVVFWLCSDLALKIYLGELSAHVIIYTAIAFLAVWHSYSNIHAFYKIPTESVVQLHNPKVTVTSGLFGDSFYMEVPETIQVNEKSAKISNPYIFRVTTSEGWFSKIFICPTDALNSSCGHEE